MEWICDYGLSLFRVFHSWLSIEGFKKVVENSWKNDGVVEENGLVSLKKKLQVLKKNLKDWSSQARAD